MDLQIVIIVILIVGFAILFWLIRQTLNKNADNQKIEDLVNRAFGLSAQKIAEQSRGILMGEKETIRVDLENK